jgi:hypothetical protein
VSASSNRGSLRVVLDGGQCHGVPYTKRDWRGSLVDGSDGTKLVTLDAGLITKRDRFVLESETSTKD